MNITLYHYWRSSSSWRVRWALEYKKLDYHSMTVDLLNGEVEQAPHLKRNPMGHVPVMELDGRYFIESLPIIEMLEELHPGPPLLPGDSRQRAHIRALSEIVNAGIQPIQNLNVLDKYSEDPEKRKEWSQFFIKKGLAAFEKLATAHAGKFSVGDRLTMADLCLIPQVYNANRFEVDMTAYPLINQINKNALETESGKASHPDRFKPKDENILRF